LKEAYAGIKIDDLARKLGISDITIYRGKLNTAEKFSQKQNEKLLL